MKYLNQLQEELEKKKALLRTVEARVTSAQKKLKLKKRELRDQVRYSLGGQILDSNFCTIFPGAKEWLYQNAITRDKKKYVEFGFHDGSVQELKFLNKRECKESAKKAGNKASLTPEESSQLKEALEKNVYEHVYGRTEEFFVFIGNNQKFYISDNVAKHLLDHEGFTT